MMVKGSVHIEGSTRLCSGENSSKGLSSTPDLVNDIKTMDKDLDGRREGISRVGLFCADTRRSKGTSGTENNAWYAKMKHNNLQICRTVEWSVVSVDVCRESVEV